MAGVSTPKRSRRDYTVACICPMGVELAPVKAMLDHVHPDLPTPRDVNSYTLGDMVGHNVAIAVLPEIGENTTAAVATQLLNDFPSIRFGLLVGIGGGIPDDEEEEDGNDIRLGDVVVSKPTSTFGGVVQYDLGKYSTTGGFERTGTLNKPPPILRSMVERLTADHRIKGSHVPTYLSMMLQKYPAMVEEYSYPGTTADVLFKSNYLHAGGRTCKKCDPKQVVERDERRSEHPKFHYGTIGSANSVVRDTVTRGQLSRQFQVMCVEMEAAGLMDSFPCLVIRGICDYADSHKNKKWQPYAAATAAAYMKDLLSIILPKEVNNVALASEVVEISKYDRGLNLFDAPDIGSDDLFVGRNRELNEMEAYFQPGCNSLVRKVLALGGLGGVGKTQLAIAFAHKYRATYSSIFWLNAASEATLKSSFRTLIGRTVSASMVDFSVHNDDNQSRQLVLNWFSELDNTNWLLIFDNYDDPDLYKITNYYPYVSHGSIIITTRLLDMVGARRLLVKPMSNLEESLDILQTRSGRENLKHDASALRLAERLAGLPLALASAGAYLRNSIWTFEQYLDEYESRWAPVENQFQLFEYSNRSLYTTWDLSYARLQMDHPTAAQLLKLLAYFDNKNIWHGLFRATDELYRRKTVDRMKDRLASKLRTWVKHDLPEWLVRMINTESEFDQAMAVLVGYCFVEAQLTMKTYSLHVCVHDWTLCRLNQVAEAWRYWYAFDCVAAALDKEHWDDLGHLQYGLIGPHAKRLAHPGFDVIGREIVEHQLEDAEWLAQLLQEQVQWAEASVILKRVLTVREKALGADHVSTLNAIYNLGILYRQQSKLAAAETMYLQALAGYKNALGADHVSTLNTVHNLGILYQDQGKLAAAEAMYLQALAGYKHALGADHVSTLRTVDNLGVIYRDQGKLDDGEVMHLRALAGYKKALGADHVSTLNAVHNLGILYQDQGKLEEAETLCLQALAGYQKALGASHISTLNAVHNLGNLYRDQGKLEEAETLYLQALAGYQKALGASHTSTLNIISSLGNLYRDQGKLEEAETLCLQALAGYEKALGANHAWTLNVVNDLGTLYQAQDKLDGAENMYRQALVRPKPDSGNELSWRLIPMINLSSLHIIRNKRNEAIRGFSEAMSGCLKVLNSMKIPPRYIIHSYAEVLGKTIRGYGHASVTAQPHLVNLIQHFGRWGKEDIVITQWLVAALLWLDDDENARFALVNFVHSRTNKPIDFGGTRCNICHRRLLRDMGYHCCRQCMDVDLCDACMITYESKPLPRCLGHEFFDIGSIMAAASTSPDAETTNVDDWIDQLKQKYQVKPLAASLRF